MPCVSSPDDRFVAVEAGCCVPDSPDSSATSRDVLQVGHGVAHDVFELAVVFAARPLSQHNAQHCHARVGDERRLGLTHPPMAERGGHRRGIVGEFGELSFAQLRVGSDDRLALLRQIATALAEDGGRGVEASRHGDCPDRPR